MARRTKKRQHRGTSINSKHNRNHQSNKRRVTRTGKRKVMTGGIMKLNQEETKPEPPKVNRSASEKNEVLKAMVQHEITFEEEHKLPL